LPNKAKISDHQSPLLSCVVRCASSQQKSADTLRGLIGQKRIIGSSAPASSDGKLGVVVSELTCRKDGLSRDGGVRVIRLTISAVIHAAHSEDLPAIQQYI